MTSATQTPIGRFFVNRFVMTRGQTRFAFCTTGASLLAMGVANAVGIGSPWWAAMAVWMVARPVRGLLLERAFFQLLGTFVGASAGAAILHLSQGTHLWSVLLLAPLLAVCSVLSNLWRHQRGYGAALCGLSATVVVVLGSHAGIDPDQLAVARALDQVVGILSACFVVAAFNPPGPGQIIAERLKASALEALDLAIATLGEQDEPVERRNALIANLARLEVVAEDAAAGSIRLRRQLGSVFGLLGSSLGLLTAARVVRDEYASTSAAMFLPDVAAFLEDARSAFGETSMALAAAGNSTPLLQRLRHHKAGCEEPVANLSEALTATANNYFTLSAVPMKPDVGMFVHHRDRAGAIRAAGRTTLCVLLTGAVWVVSDWSDSELMLLVCGVFLSLFAMSEAAPRLMRNILYGTVGALAVAALWRLYLDVILPPDEAWTLLCVAPVLFVGSLLYVQKRWAFVGLAFNMIFLLASAPTLRGPSGSLFTMSFFILAGIAITEAFFRWPLGTSPVHKKAALGTAVEREIAKLSAGLQPDRARYHRARLRHIVLLLTEQEGGSSAAAEAAFSTLLRASA